MRHALLSSKTRFAKLTEHFAKLKNFGNALKVEADLAFVSHTRYFVNQLWKGKDCGEVKMDFNNRHLLNNSCRKIRAGDTVDCGEVYILLFFKHL